MTDCVLAIDQGNMKSGWCIVDSKSFDVLEVGKDDNEVLRGYLYDIKEKYHPKTLIVEEIQSFGMPVGKSIFDSCVWAGRYVEIGLRLGMDCKWISRKDEKLAICGSMRSNDSLIRQELIRRFAKFDKRRGKGTKQKPDFFYGFAADMWSAFAIAYTYILKERGLA